MNAPLPVFRFEVDFSSSATGALMPASRPICSGAFAECSGLEATMEPKVIKAGGNNYGAAQRVGPVSFATVVLRRGMTRTTDLWKWWDLVTGRGGYGYRMDGTIVVRDVSGRAALVWGLRNALPTKFKTADLNARGSEVGVEELHVVHEGLRLLEAPS